MKILFTALALLSLASCDAPQRTRLMSGYDSLTNPYSGGGMSPVTDGSDKNNGGTTGSTTGSTGGGSSTTSEYSGCDFSYKHHTVDIGFFAICQSRTDETKFKFKTQVANRNVQVCLIPTYRDGSGNSTYLGQPQCTYTEADREYEGRLYKTRSGFTGFAINGVIVLKYGLHTSYFNCMNAAVNFVSSQCPMGAATSAACAQAANTYMAQVCESFKATYRNSYADISTR